MRLEETKEASVNWEDVVIRAMGAGDERMIHAFFDAMGAESRALFNRTDYQRKWALGYCSKPARAKRYWIAVLDGKMAGFVYFNDWDTMIPSLGIGVRDDLKGQHLGSRLMDFAIAEAKNAGKGGIRLTTHVANLRGQVLYEKKGFRCMGQYTNAVELFYLLCFADEKA